MRLLLAIALVLLLAACGPQAPVNTDNKPVIVAWVSVSGESMLPTFPVSALAEAQFGYSYDALKVGDTVIFWDYKRGAKSFTHHRLIAKQGDNWIARGDNEKTNTRPDDSWVTRETFYARTTGKHSPIIIAARPPS